MLSRVKVKDSLSLFGLTYNTQEIFISPNKNKLPKKNNIHYIIPLYKIIELNRLNKIKNKNRRNISRRKKRHALHHSQLFYGPHFRTENYTSTRKIWKANKNLRKVSMCGKAMSLLLRPCFNPEWFIQGARRQYLCALSSHAAYACRHTLHEIYIIKLIYPIVNAMRGSIVDSDWKKVHTIALAPIIRNIYTKRTCNLRVGDQWRQ